MEPFPKNPIIAAFFRNIGYADQLGSGVRNLFKYSKYYSGKDPEFIEGDIFRIIVPSDDDYSFDFGQTKPGHDAGSPGYADIEEKSVNLELLKKEGKSKGTYYVLQNKGE